MNNTITYIMRGALVIFVSMVFYNAISQGQRNRTEAAFTQMCQDAEASEDIFIMRYGERAFEKAWVACDLDIREDYKRRAR